MSGERWGQLADVDVTVNLVLLVEDDADSAAMSKLILQRHGMSVKTAKDGGQAQSSFVMNRPDFVILDLILPGESGFEICDRLKHLDASIPVLIFTAIDSEESRALATRVGADEYLTKPCTPELLVETIHRVAKAVWSKAREEEAKESDLVRFFVYLRQTIPSPFGTQRTKYDVSSMWGTDDGSGLIPEKFLLPKLNAVLT